MAQYLRALAGLPKDLEGLIPCIHMLGHCLGDSRSRAIGCPLLASFGIACTCYTNIHTGKMPIQMK